MAGMVSELHRAASDIPTGVSDLLQKALRVARRLKIIDQESWILFELEGYSDAGHNSFPSYRLLGDDIKCYCESYLGTVVAIPSLLSETGLDFYEKQLLKPLYGISVYEIERLLKYSTKDAEVSMPCPPCAEAAVIKLTGVPTPITLVFQEYSLTGILDAVRTRIREWSWKLEENGISGENLPFSDEPILPDWRRGKLVLKSVPNGKTPAVFYYGKTAKRDGITYTVPSGKAWEIVCALIHADAYDGHGSELDKSPSDQFKRGHRTFFSQRMGHDGKFWFIKTQ